MESYIYTVKMVKKRGFNREINVYQINDDKSVDFIGSDLVNTASYTGDKATAKGVIANVKGYTMISLYDIDREIKLSEVF